MPINWKCRTYTCLHGDNQTGNHHSDSMLHSWGNGTISVLHEEFQNTGCGLSTSKETFS